MEVHISSDNGTVIAYGVSYTNTTEEGNIELHWPPDINAETITIENGAIEQSINLISKGTTPLVVDMVDDVERNNARVIIAKTMDHPNLTSALEVASNENNIEEEAEILE